MTQCDQIKARSMALASLPRGDGERTAAEEHARSCADCTRALREGGQLLALVGAGLRPAPSAETLRSVEQVILRQLEREAHAAPLRARLLGAAGAALAFAALVALNRHLPHDLASWVVALAAASLAALLAALAPAGVRTATAALGASLALALVASNATGLLPAIGLKCLAVELGCALAPFGLFAAARGAIRRLPSPGATAALAAAAALAGQGALHLSCPVRGALPHLLAFHVGGVACAALLGAGFARVGLSWSRGRGS